MSATTVSAVPVTRIAPLQAPFAPAVAERLARQMGRNLQPPIALLRLFARDEALSAAIEPLGRFNLSLKSALALRDRELVILRVCARCHCAYEWGVHIAAFGEAAGLTPAQIQASVRASAHASVDTAADDATWSARDRAILAMVDELHDTGSASDACWSALAGFLDEQQMLQLLVLAGWYHAIAFVCNAVRLPPEPWAAAFPAADINAADRP